MKSTKGPAARRALFAAMAAQTGVGQPLESVQVAFSYPGRGLTHKCIYLGGYRFVHTDEAAELETVGSELVTVGVYFRSLRPGEDVATAEQDCELMADAVCALFGADPDLGGFMTWMGVGQGSGDYSETPDGPEAVLSLQVNIGAILT